MTLTVTRSGVKPEQMVQIVKTYFTNIDNAMEQLALETRDHMRQVIKQKTYRRGSTGNLAKRINAYKITNGWGIGDKQELDYFAPYWYLMNYGGMTTISARGKAVYGNFEGQPPDGKLSGSNPGGGSAGFTKGSLPVYPMTPKFPVMPKNYIEDTANWLSTVFQISFSGKLNKYTISTYGY